MQSLFAFEQCSEANQLLGREELAQQFQPNLNSMEAQDKASLKKQKELALIAFDSKFKDTTYNLPDDEIIAKAVEQKIVDYDNRIKKDFDFLRKSTLLDIEKISNTYLSILNLFTALSTVAAADKRNAFSNFTNNQYIQALKDSAELKRESAKSGSHWDNQMDKVRGWFKEIVKLHEVFIKYVETPAPGPDEQLEILKYLLRKVIITNSAIAGYFEDEDQRWAEDKEVLKSMVEKSFKAIKSNGVLELQKLSIEWEEDKEFVDNLFQKSAWLPEKYVSLIGQHTVNWEVDRLPLTDRVILQMAITEFTHFPNIPVKVTINEYIELTKGYSTPKSKQFINGILDVISKELKTSGDLKKSGRGLIDNK
jgi:N utilization substance protein B